MARAEPLNARWPGEGKSIPVDLALLALVHHRLGHADEVEEVLCRLHERMQDHRWSGNAATEGLLEEIERRINGRWPAWPAGDETQPVPWERPKH